MAFFVFFCLWHNVRLGADGDEQAIIICFIEEQIDVIVVILWFTIHFNSEVSIYFSFDGQATKSSAHLVQYQIKVICASYLITDSAHINPVVLHSYKHIRIINEVRADLVQGGEIVETKLFCHCWDLVIGNRIFRCTVSFFSTISILSKQMYLKNKELTSSTDK